jgi:serine/threonine protein kinase, bacterial
VKSTLVFRLTLALPLALCVACGAPEQQRSENSDALIQRTPAAQAVQPPPATAQSVAESIKAAIPEVTELIEVTEDNDPNSLIGRPNGYVAATVLVDSRLPRCTELGADCGVMIEQWSDQAAAQNRADYIQSMLKSMPMLGQEWNTVEGDLLLRVAGELKPSEAKAYETAFAD